MRSVLVRRRGVPGLGGWFTTKAEAGGGALIDIGVHWFDLPMYLSGLWNPTAVSAKTYAEFGPRMRDYTYVDMWAGPPNFDGVFDVEDYATGFVRFGRQATLSFEIAWAVNSEDASFVEILGDKAGVRAFDDKPLKILTEHKGKLSDIEPKFDAKVNNFESQARSFVGACRGEHEPLATAQQGLTAMKLIDGIYASSEAGAEVKIES
jgi:predicted dehydrogenase